jgi:hypothetical protein
MRDGVREDAARILNSLPPMLMPVVTETQSVAPGVSALAALVGAIVGGLLLPWPLSIGGVGAALCGAGLVWGVGHLSHTKPAQKLLAPVRPAKPGLSAAMMALSLRPLIEDRLLRTGELILAGLWGHPARLLKKGEEEVSPPPNEQPINLLLAIRRLETALADQERNRSADDATLRELIETSDEVIQCFGEEGYEWRTPLPSERYTKDLERLFRPFGLIDLDDRLVLMEPALLKNGKLIKSGCVRAA